MGPSTIFQLLDTATTEIPPGVLGLWSARPMVCDEISFGTAIMADAATAVWRVALPATPRLAEAHLCGAEARLETSRRALDAAIQRLTAFARAPVGDVTVDGSLPPTGSPEAALATLLREAPSGDGIAFDAAATPSGSWPWVSRQFQAGMAWLAQATVPNAWVETYSGTTCLGRSIVGWNGDIHTLWTGGLGREQMILHQRAVTLTVASRAALLRMMALAVRGALLLSTALAMPLSPILALPAAWTFLTAVLSEFGPHGVQP
jgi:hypothetical protein